MERKEEKKEEGSESCTGTLGRREKRRRWEIEEDT